MLTGQTSDGMRYAAKRRPGAVACCSISVGCGTRAEAPQPEGTAHFVEHAIFRGTASRSAREINSCLDLLGGELNAFTTKEEIVLHATVLKEDLAVALDLLFDLARNASFPEDEIEIERGVILDEIISSADIPSEDIYDNFESRLFAGSELGRRILGTCESVRKVTRDDLAAFYHRCFIPSNMAVSVVADLDEEQLAAMIRDAA